MKNGAVKISPTINSILILANQLPPSEQKILVHHMRNELGVFKDVKLPKRNHKHEVAQLALEILADSNRSCNQLLHHSHD